MSILTRLERLEKSLPVVAVEKSFGVQFNPCVAGRNLRECRLELLDALRSAIAHPRVSTEQRVRLREAAAKMEALLELDR